MTTGSIRLQVAPATPKCTSSRSAGRSQGRRSRPRSCARTLDGELARRLSTQYSNTQLNYQLSGLNCLSDEVPPFTGNYNVEHNIHLGQRLLHTLNASGKFLD